MHTRADNDFTLLSGHDCFVISPVLKSLVFVQWFEIACQNFDCLAVHNDTWISIINNQLWAGQPSYKAVIVCCVVEYYLLEYRIEVHDRKCFI